MEIHRFACLMGIPGRSLSPEMLQELKRQAQLLEAAGMGRTDNWVSGDAEFILSPGPFSDSRTGNIPVIDITSPSSRPYLGTILNESFQRHLSDWKRGPLTEEETSGLVDFTVHYYWELENEPEKVPNPISIARFPNRRLPDIPWCPELSPSEALVTWFKEQMTVYERLLAEDNRRKVQNSAEPLLAIMKDNSDEVVSSGNSDIFSNLYPSSITVDGITYANADVAFQAERTLDMDERRVLAKVPPLQAMALGEERFKFYREGMGLDIITQRPDWNLVKRQAMKKVLSIKFAPGTEAARALLDTKKAEIAYNTFTDEYWGYVPSGETGKYRGENQIGRILSEIRANLQEMERRREDPEFFRKGIEYQFMRQFCYQLSMYDAKDVLRWLESRYEGRASSDGRKIDPKRFSLVCYEKDGDFCHRFIVQDWLARSTISNRKGRESALLDFDRDGKEKSRERSTEKKMHIR